MRKLKSFVEIFLIVIAVKAAIIVAFILTPLTILVGISVAIWYLVRFIKEDLEEFKSETDEEDDKPP